MQERTFIIKMTKPSELKPTLILPLHRLVCHLYVEVKAPKTVLSTHDSAINEQGIEKIHEEDVNYLCNLFWKSISIQSCS